jgi:hypothetical protein
LCYGSDSVFCSLGRKILGIDCSGRKPKKPALVATSYHNDRDMRMLSLPNIVIIPAQHDSLFIFTRRVKRP